MDALISHAAASGHFVSINSVDIGSVPSNDGISAVVWPREGRPLPGRSGLATTSVAVVFMVRLFKSMNADPLSQVDPDLIDATDSLLNAYSGDFTLDGLIANVDLLGEHGEPMGFDSGFIELDESRKYRIVDITVPLVINDVWIQEG